MASSNIERRYLELLARDYPNRYAAFTEIINLQAILNLPKGTEHFISDLHGEYEAFYHILNNKIHKYFYILFRFHFHFL